MDKPIESKRAVTSTDLIPVERFLKRYETLTKDFSSRRPDAREQIIEEQIEEYKKKREKVLGGQSVGTVNTVNETQREVQEKEIFIKSNFENVKEETTVLKEIVRERGEEEQEQEQGQEQGQEREEADGKRETNEEKIVEKDEKIEKDQEKTNDNTEEYSKLSRLRLKWEETKRKKESLQKELDESYNEDNLEKLAKVLGEREKNLQVTEIFFIKRY